MSGCGVTIENVPGRPERRYCTATHRAAARQARRAAMRPEQRARLAETLPWVADGPIAPTCARGAGWRRRAAVALLADEWAVRAEVVERHLDAVENAVTGHGGAQAYHGE